MRKIGTFHHSRWTLFLFLSLVTWPSVALPQNAADILSILQGIAQTAIAQTNLDAWKKLPRDQLACVNTALARKGDSVQSLIERGVQPTDARLVEIRSSCVRGAQLAGTPEQQSPYVVDGLRLGGKVQQDSSVYRQYRCNPSEQFSGFIRCQRTTDERSSRGQFSSSYSILHSEGGIALYISRYLEPAWFSGNEAHDDVNRLSKKYGAPTRTIAMPRQSSVPNGMIATWGGVVLEPLDANNVAELGSGRDVRAGFMIDHIGNFQRSAKLGLPIYRLAGGAGYVWAASWDQNGVGTLRFLTIDASAIDAEVSNGGLKAQLGAVADPVQVTLAPPIMSQDSGEKIRADALAAENSLLVEAQRAAAEDSKRKRIADAEAAKLTAEAIDNSRRAVDEALQAKQAAELASEKARERSQLYLTVAVGVIVVLIVALAFSAFSKRRSLVLHTGRYTGAVPDLTNAKEFPEPVLLTATSQGRNPPRSGQGAAQPIKAIFWIMVSVAGFSYALSPDVRAFVDRHASPQSLLDRITSLPVLNGWAGPNLKVWTQEVYLDRKATEPILVLNIQNRGETPIVLTGASMNDDPKCFPEYVVPGFPGSDKDAVALNYLTNGIMQVLMKTQGVNILRTGYSKELKLGEIEKLSLGSPSFGGCTPVKVVITTDHGSSSFNFKRRNTFPLASTTMRPSRQAHRRIS